MRSATSRSSIRLGTIRQSCLSRPMAQTVLAQIPYCSLYSNGAGRDRGRREVLMTRRRSPGSRECAPRVTEPPEASVDTHWGAALRNFKSSHEPCQYVVCYRIGETIYRPVGLFESDGDVLVCRNGIFRVCFHERPNRDVEETRTRDRGIEDKAKRTARLGWVVDCGSKRNHAVLMEGGRRGTRTTNRDPMRVHDFWRNRPSVIRLLRYCNYCRPSVCKSTCTRRTASGSLEAITPAALQWARMSSGVAASLLAR